MEKCKELVTNTIFEYRAFEKSRNPRAPDLSPLAVVAA